MAFTERTEYKLEIVPPFSHIQCRRADIVEKDGIEVGKTYHRCVYAPGDDVTEAPSEVQAVAGALWTQELIDAYQAHLASQEDIVPSQNLLSDIYNMPCTKSDLVSSINSFVNARVTGDKTLVEFAASKLNDVINTLEFSEEAAEETDEGQSPGQVMLRASKAFLL